MTSPRRFEQDLPALLADLYLAGTPDYRDDLVQQIARVRQRPAWTFPERWLPMDTRDPGGPDPPGVPWRQLGVLALIALLLATAVAVYVGAQPRPPDPFGLAENGQLVYTDGGDVFVRTTIDGAPSVLIESPETETWALYSPLGDRLALLRETDGGEDLWVGGADGAGLTRIGGPYAGIDWVEWSPARRTSPSAIRRTGCHGSTSSRPTAVAPSALPTSRPCGRRSGRQPEISCCSAGRRRADGRSTSSISRVASPSVSTSMGPASRWTFDFRNPAWSPSGDRLAFEFLVDLPRFAAGNAGAEDPHRLDRAPRRGRRPAPPGVRSPGR